jgi:hypothetical protein
LNLVRKFILISKYVQIGPPSWDVIDQVVQDSRNFVTLANYNGADCPEFLQTEITSFWDDSNIYFLFKGSYDGLTTAPAGTMTQTPSGKTMNLWDLSDVYEVFIGPDARQTGLYKEFQIAPDNRWIDVAIDNSDRLRRSDFQWLSGFKSMTNIIENSKKWISLFIIPFTAFAVQPGAQATWDINLFRIRNSNRDSQKYYLAWAPVHQINFHQHRKFGKIVFVKE